MSPSPTREVKYRWITPRNASKIASPATIAAIASTTPVRLGRIPLSMRMPSSTGYSTVTTASRAAASRKMVRSSR